MSLKIATLPEDFEQAQLLFQEYSQWLGIDLCFQHFEKELQELPVMYGPPRGILLLCQKHRQPVACVGVRAIDDHVAELKRMYVQPSYRKMGIAQDMLNAALEFAVMAGYEKIRLDTLESMLPAMSLYEKNGFVKIPAYYFNPEENAVYYEKDIKCK